MADFLPDWYKGSRWINVEDLFKEYLQPLIPGVRVLHWVRPEEYGYVPGSSGGADPTLRLWRQPGQRDYENIVDVPLLQMAAVTRSSDDSWELLGFVDTMMQALNQGHKITRPDGSKVQVKNVGLWLGPQIVPEGPVDEFFIPMTWQFTIDGLKLQPNYRQILNSLPQ